jgi:acyl carrier protein phosphodiesterase
VPRLVGARSVPATISDLDVNFLAHLHLADPEPGLLLGGIAADFTRPAELAALAPEVQEGVRLHRLIDSFTDAHPVVRGSVARIADEYHWFAGIIIDIYYDHILAREWSKYSPEKLHGFAARMYAALEPLLPETPPDAAGFIRWMIDDNRLVRYSTHAGIEDTLARLSLRITRRMPRNAVQLDRAMPRLLELDSLLAADFHSFYPELRDFAAQARSTIAGV